MPDFEVLSHDTLRSMIDNGVNTAFNVEDPDYSDDDTFEPIARVADLLLRGFLQGTTVRLEVFSTIAVRVSKLSREALDKEINERRANYGNFLATSKRNDQLSSREIFLSSHALIDILGLVHVKVTSCTIVAHSATFEVEIDGHRSVISLHYHNPMFMDGQYLFLY